MILTYCSMSVVVVNACVDMKLKIEKWAFNLQDTL